MDMTDDAQLNIRSRFARDRVEQIALHSGRDGHVDVALRARDEDAGQALEIELQVGVHDVVWSRRRMIVMVVPSEERSTPTSPATARMIAMPRPRCGSDGSSFQRP